MSAPYGWFPDPSDPTIQRYFDGVAWTSHTLPVEISAPPSMSATVPQQQVVVNNTIGSQPVVTVSSGPNHALHLILTLMTCGFWLPIWIIVSIFGRRVDVLGDASRVTTETPNRRVNPWLIAAAIFMFPFAVTAISVLDYRPALMGVFWLFVVASVVFIISRVNAERKRRQHNIARIATRADTQHNETLRGDPHGTYGLFPPAVDPGQDNPRL